MPVDCLANKDLAAKKQCLKLKIEQLYRDSNAFHQDIRDAVEEAKSALIDFNFVQIKSILQSIMEARKFSIGAFVCDLLLSILTGPVLGTIAGKFFAGPLLGIDGVRHGLDEFERSLGTTTVRAMSDDTAEALAAIGVSKLALARPAPHMLPAFRQASPLITDVSTGAIVDSFQVLCDKLGHAMSPTADVNPISSSRVSFGGSNIDHEPTPLEYISRRANEYLSVQLRVNELTKFALEVILSRLKSEKWLRELQSSIDQASDSFGDYQRGEAKREIMNLTKMALLTMYFGSPANWATTKELVKLGPGYLETEIKEAIGGSYGQTEEIIYPLRFTITDAVKDMLLRNLLVPGKTESYLKYYTKHKQSALGRSSGLGIDRKKSHPTTELRPKNIDVNDPDSEWFTVEETSFRQLQQGVDFVFSEVTGTSYDSYFKRILRERGHAGP
jgi:hypothetical protein